MVYIVQPSTTVIGAPQWEPYQGQLLCPYKQVTPYPYRVAAPEAEVADKLTVVCQWDVANDGSFLRLRVDMPGVSAENILLEVTDEYVRVSGRRTCDNVVLQPVDYRFTEKCDITHVTAETNDGVLTVSIRSATHPEAYRVNVKKVT